MNTATLKTPEDLSNALQVAKINVPSERMPLIIEEYLLLQDQIKLIHSLDDKSAPANVFNVATKEYGNAK